MIRVVLPYHLRTLAGVADEVGLPLDGAVTLRAVLDALETRYPPLVGTLRDHSTGRRRPFIRHPVVPRPVLCCPLPRPVRRGSGG